MKTSLILGTLSPGLSRHRTGRTAPSLPPPVDRVSPGESSPRLPWLALAGLGLLAATAASPAQAHEQPQTQVSQLDLASLRPTDNAQARALRERYGNLLAEIRQERAQFDEEVAGMLADGVTERGETKLSRSETATTLTDGYRTRTVYHAPSALFAQDAFVVRHQQRSGERVLVSVGSEVQSTRLRGDELGSLRSVETYRADGETLVWTQAQQSRVGQREQHSEQRVDVLPDGSTLEGTVVTPAVRPPANPKTLIQLP